MGFGRGKIILVGEHAVVYGHPALAAGLDRGVTAHAEMHERNLLELHPWNRTVQPTDEDELAYAFSAVLRDYDDIGTIKLTATIGIPAGAGLGCSAALGVAVIDAINELVGRQSSRQQIGERALPWEEVFHGKPSGIDNMMAAVGGLATYTKTQGLRPLAIKKPMCLVVANSGQSASTKTMVDMVARHVKLDPDLAEKNFAAITSIAKNAELAAQDADWPALGQLMDMNQALLSGWMLSTSKLERMCADARAAGAFGAKLTGAGGGGCMIALCADTDAAEPVHKALSMHDPEAFITEVGR